MSERAFDLNPLVDAIADAVALRVIRQLEEREEHATPWMNTEEAIEYTRLPAGTFREWAASGRLPSHGGRRKLFHRAEVDRALGYVAPQRGSRLRSASAA
jgi:excisionase family DNA binding protein